MKNKVKEINYKLPENYKKYLEKYKYLDNYSTFQLAKFEREHPIIFYKWLEAKKYEAKYRRK